MGIVGVIVGIVAVLAALALTFLFGTVGGIIAGVLGALAVVLGILKRRKDGKGGIVAVVIGAISILMAFGMTAVWTGLFSEMHKKALDYKPDGLWAQISEDTSGGMMGIIKRIPQDEASVNALIDELNELNGMSGAPVASTEA